MFMGVKTRERRSGGRRVRDWDSGCGTTRGAGSRWDCLGERPEKPFMRVSERRVS